MKRLALGAAALGMCLWTGQAVSADLPKELFQALGVDQSAPPNDLYEALTKRYHDPAQGAGKGAYGDLWEPIPMSKYFDPNSFYKPPSTVKEVNSRGECVKCHEEETPGWVHAWRSSPHANLNEIRNLSPGDARFYKKAKLEEVEKNLRSMGRLGASDQLKEVGCIDCHFDVNTTKKADHAKDLRLPDAAVCGTCHLQEFAERESERDTQTWPNNEWPKGRPSHALDYRANVETGIWAGMAEREIAEGCTACHNVQSKCDGCHTRHEFSVVEARKPEACATCHNGIDHNNWEAYSLSKHGMKYSALGDNWNWEVELKDAISKGGQTAPTCASCHMEFKGNFSHNVVQKVRWANYPSVPGVAENLGSEWAKNRLEAWVETCSACHSERFARSYFDLIDKATLAGLDKFKEAQAVVKKLYDDGLLPGQKTNRPVPPKPEKEGPMQFHQLFWTKGNNPTELEITAVEMGENDLAKLHVGVAHVNPGGWTYTEGWESLSRAYSKIMQADTQIREMAALQEKVAKLEATKRGDLFDLDGFGKKASFGGLGGGMVLLGSLAFWANRRRKAEDRKDASPPLSHTKL
jgi:hydroxylamine dehydrogenase